MIPGKPVTQRYRICVYVPMGAAAPASADWNELTRQWERVARMWAVRMELRASPEHPGGWLDQWHLVCAGYNEGGPETGDRAGCFASVITLHDGSNPRTFRTGEMVSVLARHLRERHKGMSDFFVKPGTA